MEKFCARTPISFLSEKGLWCVVVVEICGGNLWWCLWCVWCVCGVCRGGNSFVWWWKFVCGCGFAAMGETSKPTSLQLAFDGLTLSLDTEGARNKASKSLVGKIIADRVFRIGAVQSIVNSAWAIKGELRIKQLRPNTFAFSFGQDGERKRVWENRPWSIGGAHLVLKELDL